MHEVNVMDERRAEELSILAGSVEFKSLVKETKKEILGMSKKFKRPYVSFSGGKDSTVALALCLECWPQIVVWHWDYGRWLMPRQYEQESIKNLLHLIEGTRASVVLDERKGGLESRWTCHNGYRQFYAAIDRVIKSQKRDLGITGMRKAEGMIRSQRIESDHCGLDERPGKKTRLFHPIADWKVRDVWAYIQSRNLPHHSVYERYGKVKGFYSESNRLVTFFDQEMDKFGAGNIDGILSHRFRWGC